MGIILASASPRRKRLLGKIVGKISVKVAEIDERIHDGEKFPSAAVRLAEMKARKIANKEKNAVIVGADTIAYRGKEIYRKTDDEKTARKILRELSGKTHSVITGVAVVFPGGRCVKYCEKASVRMKKFGENTLEPYLKSEEWKGRAGSYDVSGKGSALVAKVKGEKGTVIGLPLIRLKKLLAPYL